MPLFSIADALNDMFACFAIPAEAGPGADMDAGFRRDDGAVK
jgi:hypothetical protein